MQVIPQKDGSLLIEAPNAQTNYDMGNRSLFLKTNGCGDIDQIYFAHGAHAGCWRLQLAVNGVPIDFTSARAIGRLWQLDARTDQVQVSAIVFLEEKIPVVFERIEIISLCDHDLNVDAALFLDITAPATPKGAFKNVAATYIPRLPAFTGLWASGWGRWLQTPAPKKLKINGTSEISATGKAAWNLAANLPFESYEIRGKTADIHFSNLVPDKEKIRLEFALAETGNISAREALASSEAAFQNANDYAAWLSTQVAIEDPLLRSLYVAGLNAAKSMYKEFPGGFSGLVAGPDYAFPPRVYFRDGYWTAQALLDTAPELVREHLLHLAAGVHPDGQCPSGIFAAHLLKEWHAPANCNADWLPDHFDSPSFFILLLSDYLHATSDWSLLEAVPNPIHPRLGWPRQTVGQLAAKVIEYLIHLDQDGDGLIEKPYAANDWADNINRSTWVTYDQALYIAALRAYAGMNEHLNVPEPSTRFIALADRALEAMQRELWDEELGYFVNYHRPGFTEKNLSVDTLVLLYYHLLDEPHAQRILGAAKTKLIAASNHEQPYGDYGLLCAYPPYTRAADLFDKSALPYCYHNGADWPYWDGMFASILLERNDPAGLEVLSRWWQYGLEQGWLTPVEYYSPAYPVGGMLQGWSSMPAAVLFRQLETVKRIFKESSSQNAPH